MRISEVSRRTGVSIRSLRYQDKLQDVEHQMVVLTALHTRLTERIACLERQLRTQ
jgi:hypothetical protein